MNEDFDDCVKEAIRLGRKYMQIVDDDPKPRKEEWDLALILFKYKLKYD